MRRVVPGFCLRANVSIAGCLLALLAMVFRAAATECAPIPTTVIGWWPGQNNANAVAGTNHGTLQGNATATNLGMIGKTFRFDGTNDYVTVADSPLLRPTNLTVECWVKFDGLDSFPQSPIAGQQYLVFKQNTRASFFEGFALTKERVAGGDVFVWEVTSAAGQVVRLDSTTLISTGVWYHVAGTRGPDALQLFVNGQLQAQTNVSFPQDYGNFPLCFGSSGQPTYDHKLKGSLDEVTLFRRALASNEVAAIYAAGAIGKCGGAGIITPPQSQFVAVESSVTFTVTAGGFEPLQYQWRLQGTNLSGATGTALTLTGVQLAAAGDYRVVVTNASGAATSAVATLTVLIPPSITASPTNQIVPPGGTATFSVIAAGSPPLSYYWQNDNGNVSGGQSNVLTLTNVQPSQASHYSVTVSNAAGIATSATAVLTVGYQLVLLSPRVTSAGKFAFTLNGVPWHDYVIETSTDLEHWASMATVNAQAGQIDFTDTNPGNTGLKFYRARLSEEVPSFTR